VTRRPATLFALCLWLTAPWSPLRAQGSGDRARATDDRPPAPAAVSERAKAPEPTLSPGPAAGRPPQTKAAPPAPNLRALATAEGEAHLIVDGAPRTVRPGDQVGSDVVKSISPGRMVLVRPASRTRSEALVIVTFDAKGLGQSVVLWTKDPATRTPPEVR
jgi:hypothetical protein